MRRNFSLTRAVLVSAVLTVVARSDDDGIDWEKVVLEARALRESERRAASASVAGRSAGDALEERARETLARLRHPIGRESLGERAPELRRRLRRSLGIDRLPPARARALREVGRVVRPGYVIEKLVYETFPGTSVPAHLYRPAEEGGRRPAILFVPGHWWADSKSRPDFQAFSINMARRGFVVLSYDPFGQGERGISFRDHRRTSALLAGISQQGIVVFESRCALEVLLSRPDVDADRIGLTGASGGGYNTWTLTAIDERIRAAVPVVGTSEFFEQLDVCRPLDWYRAKEHCHFIPKLLRYANNQEFVAMVAPRPLLVISAEGDESFPLPGIRRVVDYGRRLYESLGRAERMGYFEDTSAGHGYQKKKREAAYGWFLYWLNGEGDGSPVAEPPTETARFDAAELRCFPEGRNQPAGPGIIDYVKRRLDALPARSKLPPVAVLRGSLEEVLGIDGPPPSTSLSRRGSATVSGISVQSVGWESVDRLDIPAMLIAPRPPWKGAVLAAADQGRETLLDASALRFAVESGWAVVAADVRGTGELAVPEKGWAFAVSLLLGESFVGRQALDLASGRQALSMLPQLEGKPIGLWGAGPSAALAALYASVLDPAAAWLVADGGFVTYRSFIDRPRSMRASYTLVSSREDAWDGIDREIPHELVPFDVLRHFDLPDLFSSLAPRPALIVRPIDGDWGAMSEEAARERLADGRFTWTARPEVAAGPGAAEKLRAFIKASRASPAPRPAPSASPR